MLARAFGAPWVYRRWVVTERYVRRENTLNPTMLIVHRVVVLHPIRCQAVICLLGNPGWNATDMTATPTKD